MLYKRYFKTSVAIALATLLLLTGSCQRSDPDSLSSDMQYYPLFSDKAFALPDTLHYFYNTIDARGIAPSGGEFSVYLKYPVLRSEDKNVMKLVNWLEDEIFILAHSGNDDNAALRKRFKADYPAYANYTLNSWLATEETTKMGCLRESLAVELVMNSEIITMKVHHKGYWGGANGDDVVRYTMFDKDYNRIDVRSIIEHDKIDDFNRLLIAEYEKNIDPWRDYDTNYKLNPDHMALIPEGLVVVYPGYAHAEGQPTMNVSLSKFIHLFKPQYRKMYDS